MRNWFRGLKAESVTLELLRVQSRALWLSILTDQTDSWNRRSWALAALCQLSQAELTGGDTYILNTLAASWEMVSKYLPASTSERMGDIASRPLASTLTDGLTSGLRDQEKYQYIPNTLHEVLVNADVELAYQELQRRKAGLPPIKKAGSKKHSKA